MGAKSMYEKRKRLSNLNLSKTATANGDTHTISDVMDTAVDEEYKTFVASNPSDAKTPSESKQRLCQMVLPGDCGTESKIAFGGFVMKLMDNAAGCVAHRPALSTVVTISIHA